MMFAAIAAVAAAGGLYGVFQKKRLSWRLQAALKGVSLSGKHVIVTGGNVGLGFEAAKALRAMGASVVIACRDMKKASAAVEAISKESVPGAGTIEAMELDLSSFKSVRAFAEKYLATKRPLHVLLNNAGCAFVPGKTADGLDWTYGVNHYGHYLLTRLLMPALAASAPSRVVNVSSLAAFAGAVDLEDMRGLKRPSSTWGMFRSYGDSKLFNVLFTEELVKRAPPGVAAVALHPGTILGSEFSRNAPRFFELPRRAAVAAGESTVLKTPAEGAMNLILAAADPSITREQGAVWVDMCVAGPVPPRLHAQAVHAERLWTESAAASGLSP
eukprot:tig00000227_g19830.t1